MVRASLKIQLPFFKKVLLFKGLFEEQIMELIGIMKSREFAEGELLTREGAREDSLFILLKGEVEISKSLLMPLWEDETQPQEKSLIHLSEKDFAFFGEMALFENFPERSASIRSLKPCTVAILEKKEFINILRDKPEIGSMIYKNIATVLTRRLVKANKDMLKLTTAFCLALEGE